MKNKIQDALASFRRSGLYVPYLPVLLAMLAKGQASTEPRYDALVFPLLLMAVLNFRQREDVRAKTLVNPFLGPVVRFYESWWWKGPSMTFLSLWLLLAVDGIIEKF